MRPTSAAGAALGRLALLACLVAGCGQQIVAPIAPAGPVVFVGVDGLSWKVIGPALARGELPTFARLAREGAVSRAFEVVSPDSPIAWTSVATGRAPEDHGITSYVTKLPGGAMIPATSNQRRAPAVWELASRHDRTVGVVGWWASWPAETVAGYVVTDHASPAATGFLAADGRYWTADVVELEALGRDYWPPELGPLLARHWIAADALDHERLAAAAGLTPAQAERLAAEPVNRRTPYSLWKTYYLVDRPLVSITVELMRARPSDLVMLYLRGPDPVQHYAWDLVEPERYRVPPPDLARDRGLVEGVYRLVDAWLAEILAARPANGWLIVASDHGAEPEPAATGDPRRGRPGGHTVAAKGVLLIHGPQVVAGRELAGASPYDILPTLLWLLGLPIAEDLEGEPLLDAFEPDFARRRAVGRIASYGARPTSPLVASSDDAALIERLRALGYVD